MALSTQRISEAYFEAMKDTGCSSAGLSILRQLLVESLSPQLQRVYDEVFNRAAYDENTISAEIAQSEQCGINHASTMLNKLSQYGLLDREPKITDKGLQYEYYPSHLSRVSYE